MTYATLTPLKSFLQCGVQGVETSCLISLLSAVMKYVQLELADGFGLFRPRCAGHSQINKINTCTWKDRQLRLNIELANLDYHDVFYYCSIIH